MNTEPKGPDTPPEQPEAGSDAATRRIDIRPQPDPLQTMKTGLSIRKIVPSEQSEASEAASRQVRVAPVVAKPERVVQVFETIRIVDLQRLRLSMRRQNAILIKRGGDPQLAYPERLGLLAVLDQLHAETVLRWPDVVVVRRPETGLIATNVAIMGGVIYLGAHLSDNWNEGRESVRFFTTLTDALLEHRQMARSQFEPVGYKQ